MIYLAVMRKYLWLTASVTIVLLSGCKAFKPSADLKAYQHLFAPPEANDAKGVRATFFGTSTILLDDGESQVLIDGFFSRPGGAKVVMGKVSANEKTIRTYLENHQINRLQGIFVCHSHYDHAMDAPVVAKLTGAKMYGSASTRNIGIGAGLSDNLMVVFDTLQKISAGNFVVTVIPSRHTPPFKILGRSNATDPCHPDIKEPLKQPVKADKFIEGGTYDFYIQHKNGSVLVKASTNYIENALDAYPTDVFFLGTAMLGLQTDSFKQAYYRHTVEATNAKVIIPVHWDNFTKPLSKPLEALPNIGDRVNQGFDFLIEKTKDDKRKLMLLQGGSSVRLF